MLVSSLAVLMIGACAARGSTPGLPAPSPNPQDRQETLEPTPPASPTLQPTEQPQALILKVPTEWAQAASGALAQVNEDGGLHKWQLDVGVPSVEDVDVGWVDAVLIEATGGIPTGDRPIALAVPFTSQWGELTLEQAETVLRDGSEFIQAMDWADMQPGMKSLLVGGYHPSDREYPIRRSFSLVANPRAQEALDVLIPILRSSIESDPHIELAAVGDLMLARSIGAALEAGDVAYPFEFVAEQLQGADLTIGNLESALGTGGGPEDKGYTFQAPPEAVPALASAGFDLLSLANNHAMDFGPQQLIDAIETLQEHGIATVGAGRDDAAAHHPYWVDQDGLTLAFLSFVDVPQEFRGFDTRSWSAREVAPGVAWADPQEMQAEIERAKQRADLVVVLLHSGYEYVPQPSQAQVQAARAALQAGADLVLGHHAHILQPVEFNPGGVIVYGLGNFVFEDAGPAESALLKVWLDPDGVRELQFLPVRLDETGRPVPLDGQAAADILASIYSYTDAWRSQTPARTP
jgi:poly-gamma-glutamate synthesis protein (capsule biosynthesis protein)